MPPRYRCGRGPVRPDLAVKQKEARRSAGVRARRCDGRIANHSAAECVVPKADFVVISKGAAEVVDTEGGNYGDIGR
jgi:hypothetical protein